MSSRTDLQKKLEEILGNRNVYFQPPTNTMIQYPAIVYSLKRKESKFADNAKYLKLNCYEIIVIDKKPSNPAVDTLLDFPYSSYDRNYVSDNLNHDVVTLYF